MALGDEAGLRDKPRMVRSFAVVVFRHMAPSWLTVGKIFSRHPEMPYGCGKPVVPDYLDCTLLEGGGRPRIMHRSRVVREAGGGLRACGLWGFWWLAWGMRKKRGSFLHFPRAMKTLLNLCCAASLVCVIALSVGGTGSSTSHPAPASTTGLRDASRSLKAVPGYFGSHARSKVVQYFDTYQTDPLGLPADCAADVRPGRLPADWTTGIMACGTVITEASRPALVEAPEELVRVLPADEAEVHYYLAGNHLVALDAGYKILDSVRIPTVRLSGRDPAPKTPSIQLVRHTHRQGRASR